VIVGGMKNSDPYINKSGHLDVGDGHKIYYEDWGNPDGFPIMHLHGGPGSGFSDSHKLIYDPKIHRVIFHDQRGSGQSLPFASIKYNTTQHLISDIERLREHFKIQKMHVAGGSWGSTLAMLYAIAHPESVEKMMMWGIYLLRQFENDHIYQGVNKETFPEAWERFISLVPNDKRKNSMDVIKYYSSKILSKNKEEAEKYAAEWTLWEMSITSLSYDRLKAEKETLQGDTHFNISMATMETHYFLNKCFAEENYILKNIDKIKHLQAYVVQGRFDMCTPPVSAIDLAKAYGSNLHLQITRAGHLRSEPENLAALRAIASAALV
jgi:proline iminopeptidase